MGQVSKITYPDTTTEEFTYDHEGRRKTAKDRSDHTTTFEYVRSDRLISVIRPTEAEQRFYHADGLGSIRFLTDESGGVTDTYTYTAFGELVGHAGTDAQPYAFAGEPFAPNMHLAYNRARWLDPAVGRFTTLDPAQGDLQDPLSLNQYSYVRDDPQNRFDPTGRFGEFSVGGLLTVASAFSTISATASIRTPSLFAPTARAKTTRVVNKSYVREFGCPEGSNAIIADMRKDFSVYGNLAAWFGPVGLPGAYAEVQFGGNPVVQSGRIPITTIIQRPFGLTIFHVAVAVKSVWDNGFMFETLPGHVFYPADIAFTAHETTPGRITFRVDVINAHFVGSEEQLLFYLGGNNLEDKIWNNLIDNVAVTCGR